MTAPFLTYLIIVSIIWTIVILVVTREIKLRKERIREMENTRNNRTESVQPSAWVRQREEYALSHFNSALKGVIERQYMGKSMEKPIKIEEFLTKDEMEI